MTNSKKDMTKNKKKNVSEKKSEENTEEIQEKLAIFVNLKLFRIFLHIQKALV